MKLRLLLTFFCLMCIGWAQADIYKRVDANGQVTYSNAPLKGAKIIHLAPLPTFPLRTHNKEAVSEFPRIDANAQKGRDNTRRKILEEELATEENALIVARNNLQAGAENPETYTDNNGKVYRSVVKQEEKMNALQEKIQTHEKNITAIKTELSNNK